jgi:hypothetical protein
MINMFFLLCQSKYSKCDATIYGSLFGWNKRYKIGDEHPLFMYMFCTQDASQDALIM